MNLFRKIRGFFKKSPQPSLDSEPYDPFEDVQLLDKYGIILDERVTTIYILYNQYAMVYTLRGGNPRGVYEHPYFQTTSEYLVKKLASVYRRIIKYRRNG